MIKQARYRGVRAGEGDAAHPRLPVHAQTHLHLALTHAEQRSVPCNQQMTPITRKFSIDL